jgi:hypothetical protein
VEREASLDAEERRPKPLKWLIALGIASLPIVVTLFMVDGFLRVFHSYLDTISKQEQRQAEQQAEAAETTLQSSEPGVIMVQPLNLQEPAPAAQPAPSGSAEPPKSN